MKNLKKYALISLIIIHKTAFSGVMGAQCQSERLAHPCPVNAWSVSGEALYLQTTYDMDHSDNGTYTNGQQSQVMIRPTNWDWGFYLDGRYHFGTANDLSIEWYHYNQKSHYTFVADGWDPDNPEAPSTIVSSFNPQWDAVNMMLGQFISLTDRTQLRLSGGAQYA